MLFFKVENLSISFGGIKALQGVSIDVEKGHVHSIIGPNGAGKTTLLNCISRIYTADSGNIIFKNESLNKLNTSGIISRGIARTFQNIELFKHMTVLENILLGCHSKTKTGIFRDVIFWGKTRKQEIFFRKKAEEIIDFLDLQPYRDIIIDNIPYGIRKNVELARALVAGPEFLLLDEPSSGLNMEETEDLAFWIQDIKEDFGITIILIEHNMRLVMDVSNAITALDYGKVLADGKPDEVVKNRDVIKSYLGEE